MIHLDPRAPDDAPSSAPTRPSRGDASDASDAGAAGAATHGTESASLLARLRAGWRRLRAALAAGGPRGAATEAAGPPEGDPDRVAEVTEVLDSLRHLFQADGGDVRLLGVTEDGWVRLRFVGACHGCAAQPLTIRGAVEPELRRRHAWVRGVRVEAPAPGR